MDSAGQLHGTVPDMRLRTVVLCHDSLLLSYTAGPATMEQCRTATMYDGTVSDKNGFLPAYTLTISFLPLCRPCLWAFCFKLTVIVCHLYISVIYTQNLYDYSNCSSIYPGIGLPPFSLKMAVSHESSIISFLCL